MATIQSLGIGSGLLTSELLGNLLQAERAPVERRLNMDEAMAEAKISAFGEVRNVLSRFNSSVTNLTRSSSFNTNSAVSSNEAVATAKAESNAAPGNYSLDVQQLAQSQSLATASFGSVDDAVGTGSLVFNFGTTVISETGVYESFTQNQDVVSRTVDIGTGNESLGGIRDAVNEANIGVQASIVDDGSGFRLLFTNSETGADMSMEITATGSVGIEALNFNADNQAMEQTVAAEDASFTVNGLNVTRSNNTVTGVIPGTTLTLADTGLTTITISDDPSALADRIDGFVKAYNDVKALTDALTDFDADEGENGQGSLLIGDAALRRVSNDLNRLLRTTISDLPGGTGSLAQIGITTNQDNNYLLEFDRTEFNARFAENPRDMKGLFASDGYTTDTQVRFQNASSATQPGTYDVDITRHATVGRYEGVSLASLDAGNIEVNAGNDSFVIVVNGQGAEIELDHGVYATADDLAKQLEAQINSNPDISGNGDSVAVSYNTAEQRFEFSSNRYGEESEIRFTVLDDTVADTLGLVLQGQGPYQGNQLASLSTPTGDPLEAFDTPVTLDSETSFRLSINGEAGPLITVPGDATTPVSYNTPQELMDAIQLELNASLEGTGSAVTVEYSYDAETGFGRLIFNSDNNNDTLRVSDTSPSAFNKLGLFDGNGAATYSTRGLDVAGTINGVEAEGSGQSLRASSGVVPAEPGFYLNAAHGDLASASEADSFRVSVDGVDSGEISLGALGTSDPVVVASAMQTAINNSPSLMAAGASVTVEYDVNTGGFGIISNSKGSGSEVQVTELQGDAGNILGFVLGRGALGKTGTDSSGEPDAAAGLQLRITGGPLGDRGSVTYVEGIASKLKDRLESFLNPDGLLANRTQTLSRELETIADNRQSLNERMARSEERLRASFLANDLIINRLNADADFLSSQLQMLEALVTPRRGRES